MYGFCIAGSPSKTIMATFKRALIPGAGQRRLGELLRALVWPLPALQTAVPATGQEAETRVHPGGLPETWNDRCGGFSK